MKHLLLFILASACARAITLDGGSISNISDKVRWDAGSILGGFGYTLDAPAPYVQTRAVDGSFVDSQEEDRLIRTTTGITTVSDYRWDWSPSDSNSVPGTVIRESLHPALIIPTEGDPYLWTYVAAGTATIQLHTSSGLTYSRQVVTSAGGGGISVEVIGYAAGSLRDHVISAVDGDLAGKSAGTSLAIFSARNTSTGVYVRNVNLWTSCDLTGTTANNIGGIVIAPDVVLFTNHAHASIGATLHFVDGSNQTISRTVAAGVAAPGYAPHWPDWWIARLSSDLPASIKPAKFLPDDWPDYLPSLSAAYPLPTIGLNQFREASVQDTRAIDAVWTGIFASMVFNNAPTDLQRLAFYKSKISGDSSSPDILSINDEPVILTVWTYGGAGIGTSLTSQRTAIAAAMVTVGSVYAPTVVDLSAFNTY